MFVLADELREQLKSLDPAINIIKDYWQKSDLDQEYTALQKQSQQEYFWQDPQQASILKRLQLLKNQRDAYTTIIKNYQELNELVSLLADDEQVLQNLIHDIRSLAKAVAAFKITILLDNPDDTHNCFLSINAGAGGTESQDWASMLLRMYVRFCEREGFNAQLIDYQPGEEAGIKSATLFVKGKNSYGLLKAENGIHRLVRISPFDANKRRHTSFAAVQTTPEMPEAEVNIDQKDLRIDTYRAGGAGGQHVNKTESAVRITHLPTNTVAQCQSERSQIQNRETAMKMLYAKLSQKLKEEQEAAAAKIDKKKIEWGSQIRSYVLHPYKLVKDHRTDIESPQPDLVLDGDLIPFIEGYLIAQATQH